MSNTEDIRDYGMDTIKAILLALMIYGHAIDDFISTGILGTDLVKALIYSFHMPAFVFISGYFRKKKCNSRSLFQNILFPYIIFSFLYCLVSRRDLMVDLFTPSYIYWYLLSLFFWCLLADGMRDYLKFSILLSALLALYAGCFSDVDRFLSASRTICMFPFFIMGMKLGSDRLNWIREQKKWIFIILAMALFAITAYMDINGIMPMHMYNAFCGYSDMNLTMIQGMILRLINMVIATLMIVCLLNVVRNKESFISRIGKNSITIFIISGFSVRILYAISSRIIDFNKVGAGIIYLYAAIVVLLTILVGNNRFVVKAYSLGIIWIGKILLKEQKTDNVGIR